jgi:hypothetical protein
VHTWGKPETGESGDKEIRNKRKTRENEETERGNWRDRRIGIQGNWGKDKSETGSRAILKPESREIKSQENREQGIRKQVDQEIEIVGGRKTM